LHLSRFLHGRSALVTGSTSGIGLGIARALASAGCSRLMLHGMADKSEVDALIADFQHRRATSPIAQQPLAVSWNSADVRDALQTKQLVRNAATFCEGRVDILVNNAGIQFVSPVENFPDEKWNDIISVNLNAVFHATKEALPLMRRQGWGRIINISSVHGLVASVNKSAYVASKHGVMGFTKTIALETAGSGVTVNAINPGFILTPLVQKQIDDKARELGISVAEATDRLLAEKQPSKQFATPEQIGELVCFLCSDAASQITGVALPVDGGWTAQ